MSASHKTAPAERLRIGELRERCLKPQSDRLGNAMARRVTRPLALRVTWVVQNTALSANAVTLLAWGSGLSAAAAFAVGGVGGWLGGALLLQVWYLLDHVDGQLARLRGTASLDGVQLDYLMHHSVHWSLPLGIGWGLRGGWLGDGWMAIGWLWMSGLLLVAARHDAAYKAFVQRLKRVQGELRVRGGGGGRPRPAPGLPAPWPRRVTWLVRKLCEMHVVMNLLSVVAIGQWLVGDDTLTAGKCLISVLAMASVASGVGGLWRSQRRADVEREFAQWFAPAEGHELVFQGGWWFTHRQDGGRGEGGQAADVAVRRSP